MSQNLPPCPKCHSEYTYEDGTLFVCPSCAHEWSTAPTASDEVGAPSPKVFKDAHGNVLVDGDTITVIKDLRIGGSSDYVKQGTKVKGIRLVESDNGHDIDCKIPGFGAMQLKSEYVKKVT